MDGNSVITQVAQQTTTTLLNASKQTSTTTTHTTLTTLQIQNNHNQCPTNQQNDEFNDSSNSEVQPFRQASEPIKSKKSKKKGFLKSLFCCFTSSKHTDANNNTYTTTNSNNYVSNSKQNDNGTLIPNSEKSLLGPVNHQDVNKKCLIIDLDETLVHSSFKPVQNADFIVPVEIEGVVHQVYVLKRPYVDEFLQKMGQLYECVLFTASLAKYADPVSDLLDKWGTFKARLFREACVYYRGNYVKDLSKLGRDLTQVLICDNSPASYIFHPDNAVPVTSWFDDPNDSELMDLIPYLERLATCDNIYTHLKEQQQQQQQQQQIQLQSNVDVSIHTRHMYPLNPYSAYDTDGGAGDDDESRHSGTELNENSIIIQVENPQNFQSNPITQFAKSK